MGIWVPGCRYRPDRRDLGVRVRGLGNPQAGLGAEDPGPVGPGLLEEQNEVVVATGNIVATPEEHIQGSVPGVLAGRQELAERRGGEHVTLRPAGPDEPGQGKPAGAQDADAQQLAPGEVHAAT